MSGNPNTDPNAIPGVGLFPNGQAPNGIVGLPGNPGGLLGPPLSSLTYGSATAGATTTVNSPFSNFTSWLPYFLAMGGVLLLVSQSPKYSGLGGAFAVLIVGGYALTHYNGIVTGFNNTFGTGLPSAATTTAPA